jgi:hypothetical protein
MDNEHDLSLEIEISDDKIEIELGKVKYNNFLIKKHYEFNKNDIIKYHRDPDIFKEIVMKISYQEEININLINLDNISYINEELKFFCLPYFDFENNDKCNDNDKYMAI